MNQYPAMIATVNHVEPVPRRIRAFLGGEKVLDTTRALYVWEWPYYPQYYIPLADVRRDLLIPEGRTRRPGAASRSHTGCAPGDSPVPCRQASHQLTDRWAHRHRPFSTGPRWMRGSKRMSRSFVHPRSPYVRVDALRSNRPGAGRA